MRTAGKYHISKTVIAYEAIAFAGIIIFVWLNEIFDLPYLLLGAESTPINWRESLIESIVIAIVGAFIIIYTHRLFQRLKFLEGILPVCASCKKIRDEKDHWHQIETYITDRSDAHFSHGLCPECAEKLYPEFFKRKK